METLRLPILALLATGPLLLAACDSPTDSRIVLDATGAVTGVVFFDVNGSGELDAPDEPFEGLPVRLVTPGAGNVVARDTTDEDGEFRMTDVPIGSYRFEVAEEFLGDTLLTVDLDTTPVSVTSADTTSLLFGLSFPVVTVSEARDLPPGRTVFVEGFALNARATFGDTTVHVQDTAAAIRTTRVQRVTVLPGDSLRVRGTTARRAGQPVLRDALPILLAIAELPPSEDLSTLEASTADGGRLDAHQVRIRDVTVVDTATVDDQFHATVDDGTGPLRVVVREPAPVDRTVFEPGSTLESVRGVLVPREEEPGVWDLRPRFNADVDVN